VADLAGTKTYDNLRAAFAAAAQASHRYTWFARQAEREGHRDVADLFRSLADTEREQAMAHLDGLGGTNDPMSGLSVGSTDDDLRSAVEGAVRLATEDLPGWAETARDEGFDDVADRLEELGRAERSHASRLTAALEVVRPARDVH
jgi:rubrerythrin